MGLNFSALNENQKINNDLNQYLNASCKSEATISQNIGNQKIKYLFELGCKTQLANRATQDSKCFTEATEKLTSSVISDLSAKQVTGFVPGANICFANMNNVVNNTINQTMQATCSAGNTADQVIKSNVYDMGICILSELDIVNISDQKQQCTVIAAQDLVSQITAKTSFTQSVGSLGAIGAIIVILIVLGLVGYGVFKMRKTSVVPTQYPTALPTKPVRGNPIPSTGISDVKLGKMPA